MTSAKSYNPMSVPVKKVKIPLYGKEVVPLIAREVVSEAKKIRRKYTILDETRVSICNTEIKLNDDFWEPAVALLHQMLKRTEL